MAGGKPQPTQVARRRRWIEGHPISTVCEDVELFDPRPVGMSGVYGCSPARFAMFQPAALRAKFVFARAGSPRCRDPLRKGSPRPGGCE